MFEQFKVRVPVLLRNAACVDTILKGRNECNWEKTYGFDDKNPLRLVAVEANHCALSKVCKKTDGGVVLRELVDRPVLKDLDGPEKASYADILYDLVFVFRDEDGDVFLVGN